VVASFIAHMKIIAIERDVDLLLVDSGDLHDGTGLTNGFLPGDAHDVRLKLSGLLEYLYIFFQLSF